MRFGMADAAFFLETDLASRHGKVGRWINPRSFPAKPLRHSADHGSGIEHMIVQTEVAAGNQIDSCLFLLQPVSPPQFGCRLLQFLDGALAAPVGFERFFELTQGSHTWVTQVIN